MRRTIITRLQLETLLGLLIALTTAGILVFRATAENTRLSRVAQAQRAANIEVGAGLYELHCRSCHGAQGSGLGQLGPPLNNEHFFTKRLAEVNWQGTLEEYIFATTSLGRLVATRPYYAGDGIAAAMTAWSDRYGGLLRDDQLHSLAAFVLNWQDTALGNVELQQVALPTPSTADLAEAAQRGEQIFQAAGCAGCHSVQGISQAEIGPDLTHIGQVVATRKPELSAEAYLRESFLLPTAFYVEGYEPEVIQEPCGGVLSEAQLDDLVAFLLSLK